MISTPPRCHGILHNKGPPDDPCGELTDAHITVSISAAGNRYTRSKLGITKSGKPAGDRDDDEQEYYAWSTVVSGLADSSEDTGTDQSCNPHRCEVAHREYFTESLPMFALRLGSAIAWATDFFLKRGLDMGSKY